MEINMIEKRMRQECNWNRPTIRPLPVKIQDINVPVVSLGGNDWELLRNISAEIADDMERDDWEKVNVPGWVNNEEKYAFRKKLYVSKDWIDKRVFLRFDGVSGDAEVFFDGIKVGEHHGGFVSWDCEITDAVNTEVSLLCVRVAEKPMEICPFDQGGIVRNVNMYVLPQTHVAHFQTETAFDETYTHGFLRTEILIEGGDAEASLYLIDKNQKIKYLGCISTQSGKEEKSKFEISRPEKWDSEHPNLYTLKLVLIQNGQVIEETERRIGFCQIEQRGEEVYVNGDLLKLRGINRHDIYPFTHRCITGELEEEDIRLFKEANVNFIRTSHYPPSSNFLDLCDKYGLYVEEEAGVAFVGYGSNMTQDDPAYTYRYLTQISSMIERDKFHPCVLIWSLGNESIWGENHALMNEYIHMEDPGRLTIFSYPITQMETDEPTDIWSTHYANWDSNLEELTECFRRSVRYGIKCPVLHDESTHVPCYDRAELRRDPGVRNFWGETIERFWDRIWETKGALGCAIWAGVDDMTTSQEYGQSGFPWGIIDGWRRKKPEYWNVKKGYSPIHILKNPVIVNDYLEFWIENRFNHTNMSEIKIEWIYAGNSGEFMGPYIKPHEKGQLLVPINYLPDETMQIYFYDTAGFMIDIFQYVPEKNCSIEMASSDAVERRPVEIIETQTEVLLRGSNFKLNFSRESGLITEAYYQETLVLTGGPFLHLEGLKLQEWELGQLKISRAGESVIAEIEGGYGEVKVCYAICINQNGEMNVRYVITSMPYPSPRKIAISSSIVSHCGGYSEVGIYFLVHRKLDRLFWKRNGQWNCYPAYHIARLEGETPRNNPGGVNKANEAPEWGWEMDEKDWMIFGKYDIGRRGTRDFRSMKTNILKAGLRTNAAAFTVYSQGKESVRMEVTANSANVIYDQDSAIFYQGNWKRRCDQGGSGTWSSSKGDYCNLRFFGNGVAWYSCLDAICGYANVYIDGMFQEEICLDLRFESKNPRRIQKQYDRLVYAVENLPLDWHEIKVEVTGKNSSMTPQSYVMINYFVILDGNEMGDTKFIINNEFNYPELSYANYMKPPLLVRDGYTGEVRLRLEKNKS